VAALEAHAEVKPPGALFEALFATLGVWFDFFDVVGDVGTGGGHGASGDGGSANREMFGAGMGMQK
jgi:hypothetical protein